MMRGVNLGNWLMLEKWMSPGLFAGTTAEDETEVCRQLDRLGEGVKQERFTTHRDEYVSDRDFAYLANHGIGLMRLPVPWFAFIDHELYVGCADYVDRALGWAEKYGLKVLIDLHTVPDPQNGFGDGGMQGVCKWHQKPENIETALAVLERLAARYRSSEALWGIEVFNEPVSPELWEALHVQRRYPPADPAYTEVSDGVPTSVLKTYYRDAYDRIRASLGCRSGWTTSSSRISPTSSSTPTSTS